jgi:hypothetical protein
MLGDGGGIGPVFSFAVAVSSSAGLLLTRAENPVRIIIHTASTHAIRVNMPGIRSTFPARDVSAQTEQYDGINYFSGMKAPAPRARGPGYFLDPND